jgi:DNA modification methylase
LTRFLAKRRRKLMKTKIIIGNSLDKLKHLQEQSINTCITSPPYWGLRDYGESDQLGLEETPEEFVNNLVLLFREVKRVLRDDGTLWLNLGDSYAGPKGNNRGKGAGGGQERGKLLGFDNIKTKVPDGLKQKDLVGIPWRVAFALQQDGWYLRQDIIWHKPNPMPESVKDRCTKAHEYIFLLSKSPKYYFDNEAIKEHAKFPDGPNSPQNIKKGKGGYGMDTRGVLSKIGALSKKNKRSVWTVTTKPFKGAHFATFPQDLIESCVLAGCPEKICVECDTPYKRKVNIKRTPRWELSPDDPRYRPSKYDTEYDKLNGNTRFNVSEIEDLGLKKQCDCETNETKPGTVLDPFGGSGTTGIVANSHNRNAILVELNPDYVDIMQARFTKELGIFSKTEII